jgi:energy-coupling factor transport system substrate-specific component
MTSVPASTHGRFPPSTYLVLGTLVVIATYAYLVIARPASLHHGGTGSAALLALAGYLVGSVLIITGAMSRLPTSTVALLPVAIALNVVVGQIVNVTGIPLYLDSIGTVLVGVLAGPVAGAATGALADVIWGITVSPSALPFAVTAAVIGLLAGAVARIGAFRRLWTALPAGLVTGIVAAIVSAPIGAFVYGNANASAGRSGLAAAFQAYGNGLLQSATLQGLVSDPLDKTLSFLIVFLLLATLPPRFRQRFPFARRFSVFRHRTVLADQPVAAGER